MNDSWLMSGIKIIQKNRLVCIVVILFFSKNSYSINCDKAITFSEKSICGDDVLMLLDKTMNLYYKSMLGSNIGLGAHEKLKATQRQWLLERNRCVNKECVFDLYKSRLGNICDYPVITGVHPVCDDYDAVIKSLK